MKKLQKPLLIVLALVLAAFACNFPPPTTPDPDSEPPAAGDTEAPPSEPGTDPALEDPMDPSGENPLPKVVTFNAGAFHIHAPDGSLLESRPAPGLASWSRPNQSHIIGENIYYVDSGGESLGGIVRKVTPTGIEDLAFTAVPGLQSLTFAISPDESKIAWAHAEWASSSLWMADIDGANQVLVAQSAPDDEFDDFFVLEAVQFINTGDLVYSWQISGIGNLFYFGYSTLFSYSPAAGTSDMVPLTAGFSSPCWSSVSEDGTAAIGTCNPAGGPEGMRVRDLSTGAETVFPPVPGQQQAGAASFSPSMDRIAYCFAERDAADQITGGIAVQTAAGEDPVVLAAAPSGYFTGSLWLTDSVLLVEDAHDSTVQVYELTMAGALSPLFEGQLIGLMHP